MGRPRRGAGELEHEVVGVAVEPVLARLVGPDDGVIGAPGVGGGVLARRLVAAADVPADLAEAQVDPVLLAHRQAVFAPPRARLGVCDLIEVGAFGHAGRSTPGPRPTPETYAGAAGGVMPTSTS